MEQENTWVIATVITVGITTAMVWSAMIVGWVLVFATKGI